MTLTFGDRCAEADLRAREDQLDYCVVVDTEDDCELVVMPQIQAIADGREMVYRADYR